METLLYLPRRVGIECPLCHGSQRMERPRIEFKAIWYPIGPFCCEAMRTLDTPEWNAALDLALANVLEK